MIVKLVPYSDIYFGGVIKVLQYLWGQDEEERVKRFLWEYCQNPDSKEVLAIIAIDEDERVIGFRGWVAGTVVIKNQFYTIARAADAVVHPDARRQGIFEKLTAYSIQYLKEHKISFIINLSSNKYSSPGNKKLGWQELSPYNIRYCINCFSMPKQKFVFSKLDTGNEIIEITDVLPEKMTVYKQVERLFSFSLDNGRLEWLLNRPQAHYIYAFSVNRDGALTSFFVLNGKNWKGCLEFFYASDKRIALKVFRELKKVMPYRIIAVWSFALSNEQKELLRDLHFCRLPWYEKWKKRPPVLVKTLMMSEGGNDNWVLNGKDIRDVNNWVINMLDAF